MFKELLESVIERTEGSLGALIMGTDGIAVEKVLGEAGMEANLDVAAAEFTSLVRNAQRAGNDTGLGGLRRWLSRSRGNSAGDARVESRLLCRAGVGFARQPGLPC